MRRAQPIRRPAQTVRGFTVVEVLVGSLILGVALVGISTAFWTGYKDIADDGDLTRAVTLASQRIEALRGQGYAAIAAGTTTEATVPGYPGFSRVTVVQDNVPTFGAKQVTVTVTDPYQKTLQLRTLIAY